MPLWYDRQGRPLPHATVEDYQAIERLVTNASYKRVAETTLPDGIWVSTVWLGVDHQWGSGPPLIFETMVFLGRGGGCEIDVARYSTEEEALAGHKAMVQKWSARP